MTCQPIWAGACPIQRAFCPHCFIHCTCFGGVTDPCWSLICVDPRLNTQLSYWWEIKIQMCFLNLKCVKFAEKLLKLHKNTPSPVVFFLAGRLPGEAQLHQKQLTLFSMICYLKGNILNEIAVKLLTTEEQTSKNWFSEIRSLCYTYNLPHPLVLLKSPPSKEEFKSLVKTNIINFSTNRMGMFTL